MTIVQQPQKTAVILIIPSFLFIFYNNSRIFLPFHPFLNFSQLI